MECQECQQRPATLHFTKIINGEKAEFHLCEECAKEKGEVFPGFHFDPFSIQNFLSGLLNVEQPFTSPGQKVYRSVSEQCPQCHLTYEQFIQKGFFGCANCYQTFAPHLNPIFRKVHSGNTTHKGKVPKRAGGGIQIRRKIEELKQELKVYVEKEEFEKAAEVRDQIRALEKQLNEL